MRDEFAPLSPLVWGFWGGALENADRNAHHAAARELQEELSVEAHPDEFLVVGERRGSDGQIAPLLLLRRPLGWRDIDIQEGAGGAFFWRTGIRALPTTKAVAWHLEHTPDLFADAGPVEASQRPDADLKAPDRASRRSTGARLLSS